MKKYSQSLTIWVNAIFLILPLLVEVLSLVNVEALEILGIKNPEGIYRVLYFVVLPVANLLIRIYKTYLPISTRTTEKLLDYVGDDMYQISLDNFRTNQPLNYSDYENLWILINNERCVIEYMILNQELEAITLKISESGNDPNTFNADKKPYPKGKY